MERSEAMAAMVALENSLKEVVNLTCIQCGNVNHKFYFSWRYFPDRLEGPFCRGCYSPYPPSGPPPEGNQA